MAIYLSKLDLQKLDWPSTAERLATALEGHTTEEGIIKELEARENQMINELFGSSGSKPITHGELRENFKKIKQELPKLNRLTGSALIPIIKQYEALTSSDSAKEDVLFWNFLEDEYNKIAKDEKPKELEEFLLKILDKTYNIPVQELKLDEGKGGGKVRALPSLRIPIPELKEIILSDLAEVTRARLRTYMNQKGYKVGVRRRKAKHDVEIQGDKLVVNSPFDWYNLSNSGYEKSKNIPKNEKLKINKKFKNEFKKYFFDGMQDSIPHLDEILDYVLVSRNGVPSDAIYIGNNVNNITGLCGEIKALCYLDLLLQDHFSLGSNKLLDWVAQETGTSGKQMHADILFQDYGIQVKNSTDELFKNKDVRFIDRKLDGFLKSLSYIDDTLREDVMDVYRAWAFNVPYVMYKKQTRVTDSQTGTVSRNRQYFIYNQFNPRFAAARSSIEMAAATLEVLFNRLIADLLYIGFGDASKDEAGNSLFIIGNTLLFASDILTDIFENINKEIKNFNAKVSYKSSYTIVNFLQDNMASSFKYYYRYPTTAPSSVLNEPQAKVDDNLYFTSSYNFGDLVTKYR